MLHCLLPFHPIRLIVYTPDRRMRAADERAICILCQPVLQFMRSYKRNDKPVCSAAAKFLGHLINQGVAHEVWCLLQQPDNDNVLMHFIF